MKYMHANKISYSGLCCDHILFACPVVERDEFQWGTEVGNITYSGNVIFIGSEELGLLKEVTPEQMIFNGTTGEIDITDGSILVIGVSEKRHMIAAESKRDAEGRK